MRSLFRSSATMVGKQLVSMQAFGVDLSGRQHPVQRRASGQPP